ncbi:glycosyltransferase [Sphingomonas sp. TREG-RG-20F-R18-01]|uniref:glycosyltransferase n=1 Tax=Sphingomonas sp. TREG-RG-20F-R18-01 TaxID=2914982 RepID=UPI001F572734|nr:glycosyltransferase [Sphingomonas sp. TREG-RG-20F-R18-01]
MRETRALRLATAALFTVLALYGLSTLPDLAARWGLTGGSFAVIAVWGALATVGIARLRERPGASGLVLLCAVMLALRVGAAWIGAGRVSPGDPQSYRVLAQGLLAGRGLVLYEPYFGSDWRALFPPAYPVVLAAWSAVLGFSTASLLALGTLTDLATAASIAKLGARLGDAPAGRRAAWLYVVWPSVLFSAPLAQKESLCALLIVLLALAWLTPRAGWRGAVALGVPAGLLALTQPGEAPLAALFGIVLLARSGWGPMVLFGLRGAMVAVVVLLPWWVRNWTLFHTFVPLTSASGASLWIGNNPAATGNWEPPPPALKGLPELTYNARIKAIALEWIEHHPAAFLRLTATKLVRATGIGVFGVVRLEAMHPSIPRALAALLWPVAQLAQIALLGATAIRQGRLPLALLLLIAACVLQWVLFGVWFEFGERHRECATPFLLLALCWAIDRQTVEKQPPNP